MLKERALDMQDFVAITKALSDSNRVRALLALRKGELCVCQIIELLGLAPSTISKHMSILKHAKLVESRKESRWVYFRMAETSRRERTFGKMIKFSISLLEQAEQIRNDDVKMAKIASEGADTLCKRQRSAAG